MNASTKIANLSILLNESPLVCIEIGLAEIERAAGGNAGQIRISDLTEITAKAMHNRPEHLPDILLVSGWMFAELLCADEQHKVVRQQWQSIAKCVEDALS
ncbi:MAG: hypothetical protein PHQ60_02205 [Sideroxydans sp.]|nr:hypothetical protein [Sideroxydans sp.]MDD5056656.1 hypothetical protein [Sideroxydans sp.]